MKTVETGARLEAGTRTIETKASTDGNPRNLFATVNRGLNGPSRNLVVDMENSQFARPIYALPLILPHL